MKGETKVNIRIPFDESPWEEPAPGVRVKIFRGGGQRVRLLEFAPGFEEPEWCLAGHAFHVLSGSFGLRLKNGGEEAFVAGDAGLVPNGEMTAHKAIVGSSGPVRLLVFEVE